MNLKTRSFERKDLPLLHELLSDEDVMRYMEPPFSFEHTRTFLEDAGLSDSPLIYAVENEIGSFIGYVIYHDYDTDSKEIGCVLQKNVWGKGYAKKLTEQLIARANSDGKNVIIECVPEHSATKHIAEIFGFKYTGRRDGCDVYKLGWTVGQMLEIREYQSFRLEEIVNLYLSAGWTNYLERTDVIKQAYANSLCVLGAYDSGQLVGIIRTVGDGQTIVFIQDIIVLPEYQRKGIGTKLLKAVMDRYRDVYQMELLTDNTEKTKAFYRSVGFTASDDIGCVAFVRM